jgi:hypothetical protein
VFCSKPSGPAARRAGHARQNVAASTGRKWRHDPHSALRELLRPGGAKDRGGQASERKAEKRAPIFFARIQASSCKIWFETFLKISLSQIFCFARGLSNHRQAVSAASL